MRIADWPERERPRERLLAHGAAALSEAELLAVFLRTGVCGTSAVESGRDFVARFGSLQRLFAVTGDEAAGIRGFGIAKYAQLKAVVELVRRAMIEDIGARQPLLAARRVRLPAAHAGRPRVRSLEGGGAQRTRQGKRIERASFLVTHAWHRSA